jgi:hypothetical protein
MTRWGLLLLVCVTGCGGEIPELDDGDESLELGVTYFNIHQLLNDDDITGGANITATQVQSFLTQKRSYLAGYTDPAFGKTAATLIVEKARASDISPLYMLARVQIESSLVGSGSSRNLVQATGCGCPDGGSCAGRYAGFGKQIECAAKLMRNYLTDLDTSGETIAEWAVGRKKSTLDPCSVTPKNRATAALYTYTPWVGANGLGCGRAGVGGSSAVARVYAQYKAEGPWSSAMAAPCKSSTLGRDVPSKTCVQSKSDARWYQCGAGAWMAAPDAPTSGTGPAGQCASMFSL